MVNYNRNSSAVGGLAWHTAAATLHSDSLDPLHHTLKLKGTTQDPNIDLRASEHDPQHALPPDPGPYSRTNEETLSVIYVTLHSTRLSSTLAESDHTFHHIKHTGSPPLALSTTISPSPTTIQVLATN